MLNADFIKLSTLVSGLMNDMKKGSLPDSLAAALKDHLPSTYCILMLLDGTRNLTTWMVCSRNALPQGLRIGSVYGAERLTSVRKVLDSENAISYLLESDRIDDDLREILATDTISVLIVPLRINASNQGVIIYGNEHQENNGIFTNEQIECAVTLGAQLSIVLTICDCFEQPDQAGASCRLSLEKKASTAALARFGEVTRAVEHEINNPLSVIVNWSEVYREDASIDPELRKKFQIIYDMSMRITEVIRKFSEMQDVKPIGLEKRENNE